MYTAGSVSEAGLAGVAQRMLDEQDLTRYLLARYTLKECAALLNVTYQTACRRARQPQFLQNLKELNADIWADVDHELRVVSSQITERIIGLSSDALDVLVEKMGDEKVDDRVRVRIAQDLLDRNAEAAKTTKNLNTTEHKFMDPRILAAAARAAKEMDESEVADMLEAS